MFMLHHPAQGGGVACGFQNRLQVGHGESAFY
jgi:hypothetical protein